MKRAAIGLRVSSEKQADEGFSLPSQMRRNVEFAQSLGFEVPDEFVFTEVFTGTKGDRPGLNKIMEIFQNRKQGKSFLSIVVKAWVYSKGISS